MEVETIILRFRDLVTADNETINEHSAIIKEYGYVWWGWWKKGNEKTPFLEFSALSAKAKEKARPIYLLDSGQSKLFKATCADIQLKSESKFSSPEKDRTPVYYSSQEYYAWFKLTSIEPCDDRILSSFSYLDIVAYKC